MHVAMATNGNKSTIQVYSISLRPKLFSFYKVTPIDPISAKLHMQEMLENIAAQN
jgi:hypothetical protein